MRMVVRVYVNGFVCAQVRERMDTHGEGRAMGGTGLSLYVCAGPSIFEGSVLESSGRLAGREQDVRYVGCVESGKVFV